MAWVWLLIAGVFEVAWAVGLKYTDGWTRLWPSLFTAATMAGSIFFLSLAFRALPLGTAYVVWTGIGAIGTAVYGMVFFAEPRDLARIACLLVIVGGIAGLKLLTPP